MANNVNVIPANADKLLFVEDLLSCVVYSHNGVFYPTWRAGPYREFIYNGFNEEIKRAVEFLNELLEWEVDREFSEMYQANSVNKLSFLMYERIYRLLYLDDGLDPDFFLTYCVRVSCMAAFFIQHGVPEVLDTALSCMLNVLQDYDMFEGGWDALTITARKHVKINQDFYNLLTPDVSDDAMSDSSDEDLDDIEEAAELNDVHEMEEGDLLVLRQEELSDKVKSEEPLHEIDENKINLSDSEEESLEELKRYEEPEHAANASTVDATLDGARDTLTRTSSLEVMHVPEASKMDESLFVQYEVKILNVPLCEENLASSNT